MTDAKKPPIPYRIITVPIVELTLGFHGEHVDFEWRPYCRRTEEAKADYDRLLVSLWHNGMKVPPITFRRHVLIGMRRIEIMRRLNYHAIIECAEIQEDVQMWDRDDIPRLQALKARVGSVVY